MRRISAAQFQKGPRPERVRLVDARQAVEGTQASNFASFISGLANTSQASDSLPQAWLRTPDRGFFCTALNAPAAIAAWRAP